MLSKLILQILLCFLILRITHIIIIGKFLMNTIVTEQEGPGFYLAQVKNSDLAIFSYYIESQKQAVIIDPVFDVQVYEQIIKKRQSKLLFLIMTHYHADFISGHLEFKVPIHMGPKSINKMNNYEITQHKDYESLKLGSVSLHVLHTPGHTIECSCFLLKDADGKNVCLFTGDTLFIGDVGRPDLIADQYTKVDLAGMLFDSLQKLKKLDDQLKVYPAHGSGSSCGGKKIQQGNFTTIGAQKSKNHALKIQGKNEFISTIIQELDQPPSYYFHCAKVNKSGPQSHKTLLQKSSQPLSVQQFQKQAKHAKIFDTRPALTDGGLISGSYWVPNKGVITSWIPMVSNPNDTILLVVEEGKQKETVNRVLRIGYFSIHGYNHFKIADYTGAKVSLKVLSGKQVLEIKDRRHLDVRNKDQWKKVGIVEGAITIPLKHVNERTHELKGVSNIVINCKSGMRARFAQSILASRNIQSIVLAEKVEDLEKIGFKVLPYVKKQTH